MATRSPGYNRLGLSIILSSLSPAITGDFFFLPLYPIPPLSATKSPALSCPSDCAKRERPSLFSDFILLPACRAKRESFSLHTFFFLKKKVRSERPSRWLPFLPKAIARSASPSFRPLSCHQPVARSVRVFLCILSFFLKKKVRSERPSRWLPFLPKAIARSASPSFRPLSCHQPVARSVKVFLSIVAIGIPKERKVSRLYFTPTFSFSGSHAAAIR